MNQWAGDFFLLLAGAILTGTLYVALYHRVEIMHWVEANVLVHGLMLGIGLAVEVVLLFFLSYLGFADCSKEMKGEFKPRRGVFRGHKGELLRNLGENPKRLNEAAEAKKRREAAKASANQTTA